MARKLLEFFFLNLGHYQSYTFACTEDLIRCFRMCTPTHIVSLTKTFYKDAVMSLDV